MDVRSTGWPPLAPAHGRKGVAKARLRPVAVDRARGGHGSRPPATRIGGNGAVQDLVGSRVVLVVHALQRSVDSVRFGGAQSGNAQKCSKDLDSQNKRLNVTCVNGTVYRRRSATIVI